VVNVCAVSDHSDLGAGLPANRRQTDELALAMFEVLRHRSENDRRHVLEALRFGTPGPDAAMRVRSVEALRLAEADTRHFPSFRRYEAWRLAQPNPREWPSGSSIGRSWGSWSMMLDALGVTPVARPATVAMRSLGDTFTRDELLDAVRACAREVTRRPLTLRAYRKWAQQTRTQEDHARIPLSSEPFKREFGGFAFAAQEAGLTAYHGASRIDRGIYSTEDVLNALRQCSSDLGERAPTTSAYRAWRKPLVAKLRRDGEGAPLPSDTAVFEQYLTWGSALRAAGLITEEEETFVRRRASRQPLNERHIARALLAAVRELGPTLTRTEYGRWLKRQPRPFGVTEAPSDQTLVMRYASWPELIATVLSVTKADDPEAELESLLAQIRR
jgi:hypothetical protein